MKKLFTVFLVVAMVFALGACTTPTNPGTTDTGTTLGTTMDTTMLDTTMGTTGTTTP